MNKPVVIIGVGEMGGVFARGFLKAGHPIFPVNRDDNSKQVAQEISDVEAVIVAVGEKGLQAVLEDIPVNWKDKLVLLQNELLPQDWEKYNLNPTVISVWFEKKKPNDYKVIIPSPVYGPQAQLVAAALGSIGVSTKVLTSSAELILELVVKNLYILTTNISGLSVGGNVGELWNKNQELARNVVSNVLDIQFSLIGRELNREQLIKAMVEAFEGDLEHKCMGRSAPARLQRALEQADAAKLEVSFLREISQQSAV